MASPAEQALQAAVALSQLHPDLVEEGCGDVAVIVAEVLRRRGVSVEVIGGTAYFEDDPVWHAWLMVEGRRVDPTWQVRFGRQGVRYIPDQPVLSMLVCFAETAEELSGYADQVEQLMETQ